MNRRREEVAHIKERKVRLFANLNRAYFIFETDCSCTLATLLIEYRFKTTWFVYSALGHEPTKVNLLANLDAKVGVAKSANRPETK